MNNSVDDRWISLSDILRAVWSLIAPLEGIRLPHLSTSAFILSSYLFKQKNLLHLIYLGHKWGLSLLKNGGSCLSFTFVHIFLVYHAMNMWMCMSLINRICVHLKEQAVVKSSDPLWLEFPIMWCKALWINDSTGDAAYVSSLVLSHRCSSFF